MQESEKDLILKALVHTKYNVGRAAALKYTITDAIQDGYINPITLIITGVDEMDYRMLEKDSFNVVGVRRTTPYGGGTWAMVKSDGSIEKMQEIAGEGFIFLGLCFGFGDDGSNDYMCGFEYGENEIPGFDKYTYPKSAWLVFEAKGAISEGVLGNTWNRIYGEFLPQSEYQQSDLPTIERYIEWDEKTDKCKVEIMIPIEH